MTPSFGAVATPERRTLFLQEEAMDVDNKIQQLKADLRQMKAANSKKEAKVSFKDATQHYAEIDFSILDPAVAQRLTKLWDKIVEKYDVLVPAPREPGQKRRKHA